MLVKICQYDSIGAYMYLILADVVLLRLTPCLGVSG